MKKMMEFVKGMSNRGAGRRVLCFILALTMLCTTIPPVSLIYAVTNSNALSDSGRAIEYIAIGDFPEFEILPSQLSENTELYQLFDNAKDASYTTGEDVIVRYKDEAYTTYEFNLPNTTFRGRGASIGTTFTSVGSFSVSVGYSDKVWYRSYEGKDQLEPRLHYYNEFYSAYSNYSWYGSDHDKVSYNTTTPWGRAYASGKCTHTVQDIKLLFADFTAPKTRYSFYMDDDTPVVAIDCGEDIRPANPKITKDMLSRLSLKVTFTPKYGTDATDLLVIDFAATEIDHKNGTVRFEALGDTGAQLLDEYWRVLSVEDTSDYGYSYELFTTAGILEGKNFTVNSPVTDVAGNPLDIEDLVEYKTTYVYLDASDPVTISATLSGEINGNVLDGTVTEPAREDMFASVGDWVNLSLVMSEQVYLESGATNEDIKLVWNVVDKNGDPIVTDLIGIEKYYPSVNTEPVSKLVFENVVVEDGMQGVIKPIELVGGDLLRDGTGNGMKQENTLNGCVPDRYIGIDTVGPDASVVGDVIKHIDTSTEKYYIYKISFKDGTIDQSGRPTGAGILMNDIAQKFALIAGSESLDVSKLTWQYALTSATDAVDFTAVGDDGKPLYATYNVGAADSEGFCEFDLETEKELFLHLHLVGASDIEINNDFAVKLKFDLVDILDNVKSNEITVEGLNMDNVKPTLKVTTKDFSIIQSAEDGNSVTFEAIVSATDMNGIKILQYQWVDKGVAPVDTAWTDLDVSQSVHTVSLTINENNLAGGSLDTISKQLYVRAYDNSTVNNMSEVCTEEGFYEALLTSVKPRYEIVESEKALSGISDVKVLAPWSTAANEAVAGYVRVIATLENGTYVRIFEFTGSDLSASVSLFDDSAAWTKVTIADGKYTEVATESVALDWAAYYGALKFEFAASINSIAVGTDGSVNSNGESDTSFNASGSVDMIYTCKVDNLHTVDFSHATDAYGKVQGYTPADTNNPDYYYFDGDITGVSFRFTLSNNLKSQYGVSDIDFTRSYAMFYKVTSASNTGVVYGDAISGQISLSVGADQNISVPALQSGEYETGLYALKIYLFQKSADGEQVYELDKVILLNNEKLPEYHGVTEYTAGVKVTPDSILDTGDRVDLGSSVIDKINLGAAPSTVGGNETIVQQDGLNAFVTGNLNSLGTAVTNGPTNKITLTVASNPVEILGLSLGEVSGIRIWNVASAGNPEELGWLSSSSFTKTTGYVQLSLDLYLDKTNIDSNLVSPAVLATSSIKDGLKFSEGTNVIAYQILLDNGKVSQEYRFEVNISTAAPEFDVTYTYDSYIDETLLYWSCMGAVTGNNQSEYVLGTDYTRRYAENLKVLISNLYTMSEKVDIYRYVYDYGTQAWTYTSLDASADIAIDSYEIQGYYGYNGTDSEDPKITEFFLVIDGYGNAKTVYPIIGEYEATVDVYDVWEGGEIVDQYFKGYDTGVGSYGAFYDGPIRTYQFVDAGVDENNLSYIGSITPTAELLEDGKNIVEIGIENYLKLAGDIIRVSVDGGAHVDIHTSVLYYNDSNIMGVNPAGVLAYNNFGIYLTFPYDENAAEGEMIEHTVTLSNYIRGDLISTKEVNVSVPNVKPALVQSDYPSPTLGNAPVTSNVFLYSAGITEYDEECRVTVSDYGMFGAQGRSFADFETLEEVEEIVHYTHFMNYALKVYKDGTYTNVYYDKFGTPYELSVEITGMPEDPTVEFSTTELTKDPVTVTINTNATGGATLTLAEGTVLPDQSVVTGEGTTTLTIELSDNAEFTVIYTDPNGYPTEIPIAVDNMHVKPIVPTVRWHYNKDAVNENNEYYGNVTAMLVDENGTLIVDGETGLVPTYTFVASGPTSYTFTGWKDIFGESGADVVAELPVTIKEFNTEGDSKAPNIALSGYKKDATGTVVLDSYFVAEDDSREVKNGIYPEISYNSYVDIYGADKVYTDISDYLEYIGWGEFVNLDVNVFDESGVKVFVKADKYGATPTYNEGISDVIPGVTLIGHTLRITDNCSFALYVVDTNNNATAVWFDVIAMDDVDQILPTLTPVLTKDGNEVRIYATAPAVTGVTGFKLTNSAGVGTEDDDRSEFYNSPYLSVYDNGTYTVYYEFYYEGAKVTSQLDVVVDVIDNTPLTLAEDGFKWSANYDGTGNKLTNENIVAQLTFTRDVTNVYLCDAEGNPIITPYGVTLAWVENRVTVIYDDNFELFNLSVTARSNKNKTTIIPLAAITTIDRIPAEVTYDLSISENYASATLSFTADETVIWPNGKSTESYSEVLRENGTYEYKISDKAGNITVVSVELTQLVTDPLVITVSTTADGKNVVNPETHFADVGDAFYVQTNRTASLRLNGNALDENAGPGTWVKVTVQDDSIGHYPSLYAVDTYGNSTMVQFLQVPVRDRTAPAVMLNKGMISASLDCTREELIEILRANITSTDNETAPENLVFSYELVNATAAGKYKVTYMVTDEAGNTGSVEGWIRLYSGEELKLYVNGNMVERDETVVVAAGEQKFKIEFSGESYEMVWRNGVKLLGQMKNNPEILIEKSEAEELEVALELTDAGYYTFLVTTQGRDSYRFILYVEG